MLDSTMTTIMAGAGCLAGLTATLLWRLLLARRIWRAGATLPVGKVSAYQMALMNGGPSRVALTGVVRLLGRKVLVPGIEGVLMERRTSLEDQAVREPLDAVEQETLAAARTPAVFRDLLIRLKVALKQKGIIAQLRRELAAMGYMQSPEARSWGATCLRNMLPALALLAAAFGIVAGLDITTDARNALSAFGIGVGLGALIAAWPTRVTALGRYIAWSATQHHPDFRTARATHGEALDPKALGQSVALYGPDALAGSDMAWIPALMARTVSSD